MVINITLPHGTVTLLPSQSEPIVDLFYLDRIKDAISVFEGSIVLLESEGEVELPVDTSESEIVNSTLNEIQTLNSLPNTFPNESEPLKVEVLEGDFTPKEIEDIVKNAEECNPEDCKDCGETRCLKYQELHKSDNGDLENGTEETGETSTETTSEITTTSTETNEEKEKINKEAVTKLFNSEKIDKNKKREAIKKIATHLKLDFNNNIPTEKLYNLIIS